MSSDLEMVLGRTREFRFRDKAYTLIPWDRFDLQKAYVQYLKKRAYEELANAKQFKTQGDHEADSAILQRDIAGGAYNWGGRVYWESLSSPEHAAYLTWLDLRVNDPEVELQTVYEMYRDKEAVKLIQEIVKELMEDPNSHLPALPALAPR